MSDEKAAWERLILMGLIPPDEHFSPSKAKEGSYSAAIRKADVPDLLDEQPQRAAVLSTEEQMQGLRVAADKLIQKGSTVPRADRLIHLRQRARDLGLPLRDNDIQRVIWDARRRANGAVEVVRPGDVLDLSPTRWAIEGVLMAGTTNLIVALPKIGKTNLLIAAIAAWHRGDQTFLGQRFHGPCPPIIIAGTDMPVCDWGAALRRYGLMGADSSLPVDGPIKALFHAGAPIHLDQDGIDKLTEEVSAHPGCLVLLDSYAKLVGPLGITEIAAEYAGPLGDCQESLAPYNATLAVVHHSGKAVTGDAAALASRGTTALPAAVSQIVALSRFAQGGRPGDRRVLLRTEGRGGEPLQLLIEQEENGWHLHGDAGVAMREEQLMAAEESLTDRQATVLELVRDRWAQDRLRSTYADVLAATAITDRSNARRTLKQLEQRGLLAPPSNDTTATGRTLHYWPVEAGSGSISRGDESPPAHLLTPMTQVTQVTPADQSLIPLEPHYTGGKGDESDESDESRESGMGGMGHPFDRSGVTPLIHPSASDAVSTAEVASRLGLKLQTLSAWASRKGAGAERDGWRLLMKRGNSWLWSPVSPDVEAAA